MFLRKGTCSQTFFYLLNREYDHHYEAGEKAADPLAGGIMQLGHQCGMLWGSALAVGAESRRRTDNPHKATAMAINATRSVMDEFYAKKRTHDCYEITRTDFTSGFQMFRYMIFGAHSCFRMAKKVGPGIAKAAEEGLAQSHNSLPGKCLSCATETAKKMGATEEQAAMAAGLAGGMGLSGNACGALGAAIWLKTLQSGADGDLKANMKNPAAKKTLDRFYEASGFKILCRAITERNFATPAGHTAFIEKGGCKEIIEALAGS